MSTSPSEHSGVRTPAGLYTKDSDHPIAQLLLGRVVGAFLDGDRLVLYYDDQHSALLHVDHDGDLCVHDHKVPTC